jgi:hypothetical protein
MLNSIIVQKTPYTSKYIEFSDIYICAKKLEKLFFISVAHNFILVIVFLYDISYSFL